MSTPMDDVSSNSVEESLLQYVQREQHRPGSLVVEDMPEPIPVIDLSRLPHDAAEADKLQAALESWGLVLVTGHGIEESLMDDMLGASRDFFHQPLEVKQKYRNLVDGNHITLEGYGGDQVVMQDQILDWSEWLQLIVEPENEQNLALWPKHSETFRNVMDECTSKTKEISNSMLQAMARILKLDEDYFVSQISDKPHTLARLNYYPPCPRPDLVNGLRPHTDGPFLTILLVDKDIGGLQVQLDGIWYNVPCRPHTLLIILGDRMEIMSNGIFKSPVHRVVTNAINERVSFTVFYAMDGDRMIEPATGLLGEKRPARYRAIGVKDFVAGYHEHYSRGTSITDSLRI